MSKIFLLLCALSVVTLGCDKKEADSPAGEKAETEKKIEAKPLETLFATKAPTIPAPYKTVRPGMTLEEAKKVFPDLPKKSGVRLEEYPDMRFTIDIDKKTNIVRRLYTSIPKATGPAMLAKAWGEPKKGMTSIKKPISYWFNPAEGIRATLEEGYGEDMSLEFTNYTPVTKFVGTEGKDFAFESKQKILGATIEELRKAYPKALVEKSQKQASADRKKMEKMMGKDANKLKVLGKAKPSAHLDFMPIEYESFWTRVNLSWDDQGKVMRYRFKLGFESVPAEKDAQFAMLKKKFGEVTEEEKYGKKIYVASQNPRIVISEDTISKGWDVEVEAAK